MTKNGDRVRLVYTDDPYTRLRPGVEGTVVRVVNRNDSTRISVDWDDGSKLSLSDEYGDRWEVVC